MKTSAAKPAHLPYDRWTRHVAENGLEYLAHPNTGEVKWLWSRHRDPTTGKDYLVNTVTSFRQWVNPSNEHLCPVRMDLPNEKISPDNVNKHFSSSSSVPPANPLAQKGPAKSALPGSSAAAAAAAADARHNQAKQFVEVAAPKSLGLGLDEVLMETRGSGRRYIFNKRTNRSRWVPGQNRDMKPSPAPPPNSTNPGPARSDAGLKSYPASRVRTAAMPTPPPRLATEQAVAHANPADAGTNPEADNQGGQSDGSAEGAVQEKLKILNDMVERVDAMTTSGKFAINALRQIVELVEKSGRGANAVAEEATSANQRLLELNEYLMQQTLTVDGVESQGDARVRKRRKETVDKILYLIKQTEELRRRLRVA